MADFFTRTQALADMVGDGHLVGTFAVDGGKRTKPLEVGYWTSGPLAGVRMQDFTTPGTGPHAAQHSFEAVYERSLEDIARTTLEEGPKAGMARHVERVNDGFKRRAPRVTGQYSESTARIVTDDGVPVHQEYGASYGEDPGA